MKSLLTILLIVGSFTSCAQKVNVFKMQMNVRVMNAKGEIVCKNDVPVIWGTNRDTIAFVVEGRERHFYNIDKWSWCDIDERTYLMNQVRMYSNASKGIVIRVVQNDEGDKYLLKILTTNGDVAIYLINIHEGLPTYQFGFGCNECLPHELASVR